MPAAARPAFWVLPAAGQRRASSQALQGPCISRGKKHSCTTGRLRDDLKPLISHRRAFVAEACRHHPKVATRGQDQGLRGTVQYCMMSRQFQRRGCHRNRTASSNALLLLKTWNSRDQVDGGGRAQGRKLLVLVGWESTRPVGVTYLKHSLQKCEVCSNMIPRTWWDIELHASIP